MVTNNINNRKMSNEKAAKLSEALFEALAVDGEMPAFVLLWVPDDGNFSPETVSNITTLEGTGAFLKGAADFMEDSEVRTRGTYMPKGPKDGAK